MINIKANGPKWHIRDPLHFTHYAQDTLLSYTQNPSHKLALIKLASKACGPIAETNIVIHCVCMTQN